MKEGRKDYTKEGRKEGRKGYMKEGRKDYTKEGRKDYTKEGRKDYTKEGRKDYMKEGRKDYTKEGRKDYTKEGRKDYMKEGRKDYMKEGLHEGRKERRRHLAPLLIASWASRSAASCTVRPVLRRSPTKVMASCDDIESHSPSHAITKKWSVSDRPKDIPVQNSQSVGRDIPAP
jgi:hypothetical protein